MRQVYVKACRFDMPGIAGTSYGYFEKPVATASTTGGNHVAGTATVAYCANDLPNPTFRLDVALGLITDKDGDRSFSDVVILMNVVHNVRTNTSKATVGEVKNFDAQFRITQSPF
jgi:hypothetical protein